MATTHATHLPALGAHQREEVGNLLQATVIELTDLALVGKHLHWNVVGPHFRSLHLQLDELIDSWRLLGDTVAERAVAIGFQPDGQSATVAAATEFETLEQGAIEDHVVVRELANRLATVSENVRTRMDRLGELDGASEDVLTEVLRGLEENLWMVRAQIPSGH